MKKKIRKNYGNNGIYSIRPATVGVRLREMGVEIRKL